MTDREWLLLKLLDVIAGEDFPTEAHLKKAEKVIDLVRPVVEAQERRACARIFDEWPNSDLWRGEAAAAIRWRQ